MQRDELQRIDIHNINITVDPTQEALAPFYKRLSEYNAQFLTNDFVPFAAIVNSDESSLIGGIMGNSGWGRMHIENLWVAEPFRGQGVGRKLMQLAEKATRERNCWGIDLDTFSFQAPGFYEKLGFRRMGEIPGYAGGHVRFYYSKEI